MNKSQYRMAERLRRVRDVLVIGMMITAGIFSYQKRKDSGSLSIYKEETTAGVSPASEVPESHYFAESGRTRKTYAQEEQEDAEYSDSSEGLNALEGGSGAGQRSSASSEMSPDSSENPCFPDREDTGNAAGVLNEEGRININQASAEELQRLPSIGPKTAELIIAYRQRYGGFATPEEIKNVKRIGEKTYEKLKDLITVG